MADLTQAQQTILNNVRASALNEEQRRILSKYQNRTFTRRDPYTGMLTEVQVPPGRDMPPQRSDVFEGLSPEVAERLRQQSLVPMTAGDPMVNIPPGATRFDLDTARRLASMERMRILDPQMAQRVETMSPLEAGLAGAGERFETLGRAFGADQPTAEREAEVAFMKEQRPAFTVGQLGAETGVGMALGGGLGALARFAAPVYSTTRAGLTTTGLLTGASEAGLYALGEDASAGETMLRMSIGGLTGMLWPGATPTPKMQQISNDIMNGMFGRELKDALASGEVDAARLLQIADRYDTPLSRRLVETLGASPISPQADVPRLPGPGGPSTTALDLQAVSEIAEEGITAGARDRTSRYILNNKGNLLTRPVAVGAEKIGISPGYTSQMLGASLNDKAFMLRMLKMAREGRMNRTYSRENPILNVVGEIVEKRFRDVQDMWRTESQSLKNAVLKSKDTPINANQVRTDFMNELQSLGVSVGPDGKLDFSLSQIMSPTLKKEQKRLQTVYDWFMDPNMSTVGEAHRIKENINTLIPRGAQRMAKPLNRRVERVLERSYTLVNRSIQDVSEEYREVNGRLSEILGGLELFNEAIPSRINLMEEGAIEELGLESRKLLSNYGNRPRLNRAFSELQEISGEEASNLPLLVDFESMMNAIAPELIQPNTFGGNIRRATGQQALDIVTGPKTAIANNVMERLFSTDPDEVFDAVERVLRSK